MVNHGRCGTRYPMEDIYSVWKNPAHDGGGSDSCVPTSNCCTMWRWAHIRRIVYFTNTITLIPEQISTATDAFCKAKNFSTDLERTNPTTLMRVRMRYQVTLGLDGLAGGVSLEPVREDMKSGCGHRVHARGCCKISMYGNARYTPIPYVWQCNWCVEFQC